MSEKPVSANPIDDSRRDQASTDPDMASDSKKDRGLLQVPSRSSSNKNHSSPASTGLSGATASESRNSISGRSKDSRSSFLGRQRNGSVSSKRTGGDSDPTNTANNSMPSSPVQKRKKKSGGLLSFLGCCAAPDTTNGAEGDSENVHKLDKLPQRPATAKSRTQTPQDQGVSKVVNEKDSHAAQQNKDLQTSSTGGDQIAPVDGDASTQPLRPAVTVESSKGQTKDTLSQQIANTHDTDDIVMQDVVPEEELTANSKSDESPNKLPPPPPTATAAIALAEAGPSAPEPTKWLLPPISPEHSGRKCLVLDLDETLVHSSFKVDLTPTGSSR